MVERRARVTAPRTGPPPPRPPARRRILARRVGAVGALALTALVVFGLLKLTGGGGSKPATTSAPTTPAAPKPFRIVFPEGFTRREMAQRVQVVAAIARRERHRRVMLSKQAYLAASQAAVVPGFGARKRPLEGFLFPATYDFLRKTTSAQLVRAQLAAFRRNWRHVNLSFARAKNLTPYDVLIIASMVEKEALVPDERRLIAAVIYNRLHDRIPLGIDATIRYGLDVPGTRPLRQSQLQSDNAYNTRRFPGLPPTPIANPGLASMQAAAHPARVDYLYFVRKPDKRHHYFTASFQDFVNHEIAYGYK